MFNHPSSQLVFFTLDGVEPKVEIYLDAPSKTHEERAEKTANALFQGEKNSYDRLVIDNNKDATPRWILRETLDYAFAHALAKHAVNAISAIIGKPNSDDLVSLLRDEAIGTMREKSDAILVKFFGAINEDVRYMENKVCAMSLFLEGLRQEVPLLFLRENGISVLNQPGSRWVVKNAARSWSGQEKNADYMHKEALDVLSSMGPAFSFHGSIDGKPVIARQEHDGLNIRWADSNQLAGLARFDGGEENNYSLNIAFGSDDNPDKKTVAMTINKEVPDYLLPRDKRRFKPTMADIEYTMEEIVELRDTLKKEWPQDPLSIGAFLDTLKPGRICYGDQKITPFGIVQTAANGKLVCEKYGIEQVTDFSYESSDPKIWKYFNSGSSAPIWIGLFVEENIGKIRSAQEALKTLNSERPMVAP